MLKDLNNFINKPKVNIKTIASNNKPLKHSKIYLDFQATTPVDPRILDAMLPFATTHFGNSSSRTHHFGWTAENAVNKARSQIANLINADPNEIIFTSGATESNNLALKGLCEYKKLEQKNPHFITLQTEHKSVLNVLRNLNDAEVTYLPVLKNGRVDLEELKKSIKPNTVCVSIMGINNEIGVVQDLKAIGSLCKEHDILFHCDAAQAFGKIPIDVKEMNIGLMSISGHKIYGPKGVGCLFVRKRPRVRIEPIVRGGGHERGLRSGSVPVFLVVGLGKAAEIAKKEMIRDYEHVKRLSTKLLNYIKKGLRGVIQNGTLKEEIELKKDLKDTDKNNNIEQYTSEINKKLTQSNNESKDKNIKEDAIVKRDNNNKIYIDFNNLKIYPGCLNLSFDFVEGESLLMAMKDIALSSGSACTSASLEPSYTLRALGTDDALAHSSIRFGIGRFTNKKDVEKVGKMCVEAVDRLRKMSPLAEMAEEGIDINSIQWNAQ